VEYTLYNNRMNSILFRAHAVQRMFERGIPARKVREAVMARDIIEDYSPEMPEPGWLLFGMQGKRPFHVVTSQNEERTTVITVYLPSPGRWKNDSRSRRCSA
jgi:hypothetical protein